jgi:hypothetical protein
MIFTKLEKPDACKLSLIAFGLLVFLQLVDLSTVAPAQAASFKDNSSAMKSGLNGLRFIGPFGAEAETKPKEDSFTFKDGKFATASCLKWGFVPAPFWTRRDSNGLHFLAELKSPDHGTMRYEGVFDGKELTVVGYWKKERWYWTVERTYRGKGRLSSSSVK